MLKNIRKYISLILIASLITTVSCGKTEEAESQIIEEVETVEIEEEPEETTVEPEKPKETTYELTEVCDLNGYIMGQNQSNEYIEAVQISDGDGNFGLMLGNGEILVEPQYDDIILCNDTIIINEGDYCYFTDLEGKLIFDNINGQKIASTSVMNDGYVSVVLYTDTGERESKNYIVDSKGNIVYETEDGFEIRTVWGADNVYFVVDDYTYSGIADAVSFIRADGSEIPEEELVQYEDIMLDLDDGNLQIVNGAYFESDGMGERYAIYDNVNDEYITGYDFAFDTIKELGENIIAYKYIDDIGNYCIIDSKGNVLKNLTETIGDDIMWVSSICNGEYAVVQFAEKGIIILDKDGNILKETDYISILESNDGVLITHGLDGKSGYLDENLEEILEPIYDEVTDVYSNVGFATKDNKLYRFEIIK